MQFLVISSFIVDKGLDLKGGANSFEIFGILVLCT